MSVVLLDEYKSSKTINNQQEVVEERARILSMVSQKAQEKTLTLQETTDLYAQFNSTYDSAYTSKLKHQEDESWALKLLQECEDETNKTSKFETRVNGIPLKAPKVVSKQSLQLVMTDSTASNQHFDDEEDCILVENKPKLRDSFIYEQLVVKHDYKRSNDYKKSHQAFVTVMAISIATTLTALIGGALFL